MTEDHPQKVDFDFFPNYTTRAFRPYAIAIGEVALLGRLFWTVSGPTRYNPVHSTRCLVFDQGGQSATGYVESRRASGLRQ